MGQRQNQSEPEWGRDCALKFAAGETPAYLYARFSGIETCPGAPTTAPNDHTFRLTQDDVLPCFWHYDIAPWYVSFEYDAIGVESHLFIRYTPTFDLYFDDHVGGYTDEGHVYENEQVACIGVHKGIGGIAIITWRLESLKVMDLLNIDVANSLFMELFPLDDGSRVYKYCNRLENMNIKIKYDP